MVVDHLPSLYKDLGSIPSAEKTDNNTRIYVLQLGM